MTRTTAAAELLDRPVALRLPAQREAAPAMAWWVSQDPIPFPSKRRGVRRSATAMDAALDRMIDAAWTNVQRERDLARARRGAKPSKAERQRSGS